MLSHSDLGTVDRLLLDIHSVAQLLSLSSRTVRRLERRGQFPEPMRIGRSVRWRSQDVLTWLAEGSAEDRVTNHQHDP